MDTGALAELRARWEDGESVQALAAAYGVATQTVYQWLKRAKASPEVRAVLTHRSTKDAGCVCPCDCLCFCAAARPDRGCRTPCSPARAATPARIV